jgi:LacI family transcriptional regulator
MVMRITRKDVARFAGVSTATVSYVVNDGPRPVSEETRKKVLSAIDQLGYRPSAIARSLVTKKTNTIGFILPDILNPIHAAIAKAFEDALRAAGYSLIIGNSDETPDLERVYLNGFLSKELDGIALTPTGENRRLLFSMVESGKCLVLLDRQLEGLDVDCVLFDNMVGAYQAVRHLIERGHSRIGLINLSRTKTPGRERLEGYQRALLEAGIQIDQRLIMEGSFKAQEGEVLAESLLAVSPPPTALFVGSNRLMTGVLHIVKQRRLRVPEDLALATFDDVGSYANRTPSITAVSTSMAEFGSEAARLLIERVSGTYAGEPQVIRIHCELRVRESTAGIS